MAPAPELVLVPELGLARGSGSALVWALEPESVPELALGSESELAPESESEPRETAG